MKNKIKKVWEFIFKNDPNLQNIPLHIIRKTVNVDGKLQSIFLRLYLSTPSGNSPHNITPIIGSSYKKRSENEPN